MEHAHQRGASFGSIGRLVGGVLFGALLFVLVYQVPAAHAVDIGGYDSAYVQGFFDPSRADAPAAPQYLEGSDGSARWTRDTSSLIFPQIGLPAELTLRLRAAPQQPAATPLVVLLNGTTELGRITPGADWGEYRFPIAGGMLKPSDVVIELRSATTPLSADDARQVGVLLDRATLRTSAWPIMPYPAPLALGMLGAGLLALLVGEPGVRGVPAAGARFPGTLPAHFYWLTVGLALAFLLLYRLQPLYPYPLRRLLPAVDLALAGLVALRYGPTVAARFPRLLDALSLGGAGMWLVATLVTAQRHVVLSRPGVETDFSVFARRSEQLLGVFQQSGKYTSATDGVLRADGFYNLGYPLLLWLLRPLTSGNPFLAGRIIAGASGFVLLLCGWWMARRLFGPAAGAIALACLAFSPLVAEYGLYLGTDMPFAAFCALALALLVEHVVRRRQHASATWTLPLAAGLATGAAFLMRHPGLVLLPFGLALLLSLAGVRVNPATWRVRRAAVLPAVVFLTAFFVAVLPQVVVNMRDTGNPLFSWQAKNIWLAVYADADWSRQGEERDDISLREVVLRDPVRFATNWATNVRGFLGAGGENTSEFGRADQLRLLAFPANWLAIAALLAWLAAALAGRERSAEGARVRPWLLGWVALYMLGVSVGLALLRFTLPVVVVYAAAAAWGLQRLAQAGSFAPASTTSGRALLLLGMLLCVLMWGGYTAGTGYVLSNQPTDELAATRMIQQAVQTGQHVHVELGEQAGRVLFDEYSAVSHLVAPQNMPADFTLRPASASPGAGEQLITSAGGYSLYRKEP